MEPVGLDFCFEELLVGRHSTTVGRTITEANMMVGCPRPRFSGLITSNDGNACCPSTQR